MGYMRLGTRGVLIGRAWSSNHVGEAVIKLAVGVVPISRAVW